MRQRPQEIYPQGHGSALDADLLDGKHAADIITAARAGLTDDAEQAVRWEDVAGKPATFPPAPHTHPTVVSEAGERYIHTQELPREVWTVAHGLGCYPAVIVVDWGRAVVLAAVAYLDENTVQVSFNQPVAGYAYCG